MPGILSDGVRVGLSNVSGVSVCEACAIVVPPDRDNCPNGSYGSPEHPLRTYVPRDEALRVLRAEGDKAAITALNAVEAIVAVLKETIS